MITQFLSVDGPLVRACSFASRSAMTAPTRRFALSKATSLLACVALVVGGRASAQLSNSSDLDGDGMPLSQEMLLGTSPTSPDTDGDGVSDLEEIARHSQPLSTQSTPDLTKRLSVGVMVNAQSDGLHGLICVFMADTDLRDKHVQIGFVGADRYIVLSNTFIAQHSTVRYVPSVTQSGCVAVIDLRFSEGFVHQLGDLSLWARASVPNSPVQLADSAHMLSIAGLVLWAMPAPAPVLQKAGCASGSPTPGGSIYVPLLPPSGGGPGGGGSSGGGGSGGGGGGGGSGSSTIPITWASGEVCFQRSAPVGTNGATITNEIISANCVGDWDGFCPPTCSQSVGTTYRTVDPIVLIGG